MQFTRRDFGSLLLGSAAVAATPWLSGCATSRTSADSLPRRSPSEQGVDAKAVLAFLDDVAAESIELHSLMLYRRGAVVAEGWWWPYRSDRLHMLHSQTKSVTACAIGLAIAEGKFKLDDKVLDFFAGEVPPNADPKLSKLTVRDLLTMQTGHEKHVSGSVWRQIKTSWVTEFFKIPLVYDPGTTFVYSSASSYMLGALIARTTGQTLQQYLEPRFFQPLDIRNYQWDIGADGINPGSSGLSWTTLDSLKLGLVHLQGGQWQGKQVLPADWVREATKPQATGGRYGYQWWIGPSHRSYYAVGLFGEFSFVFPEHDAVLALTAGTDDDKLRKIVWRHFPDVFSQVDASSDRALSTRCSSLRVLPSFKAATSARSTVVSGKTFEFKSNDDQVSSIRLDFARDRCDFTMQDARGTHKVAVGLLDYIESDTTITGGYLHHQYEPGTMRVVAGGRWLDERTFEMTWQFVESAFRDTVVCRFDGNTLTYDRSVNVNSAATSRPTLTGTLRA